MPSSNKSRKRQPNRIDRNASPTESRPLRRSFSLSSYSSSNNNVILDYHKAPPAEHRRRQARPRSRSLSSDSGDSSITTPVDKRNQRRTVSALYGAAGRLFTQSEDRAIVKSLRKKLLVNDGKRLNRIERHLLRAMDDREHREDGWVSASAFEEALLVDAKANGNGEPMTRDEVLWLSEKLESRNRKKVSCYRIRSVLERDDEDYLGVNSGKNRARGHISGSNRRWKERTRTRQKIVKGSDSDSSDHQGNRIHRSRHPAEWAVRQGTVGQWLQDVASPMENKLFFEFIKSLEKFEHRNGLDHYRMSSTHNGDRNDGGDGWKEGTTVVHLGPMLKAAIRFYV